MSSYKLTLRAKGIKPIPAYAKLRTVKRPGELEQKPGGEWHRHGEDEERAA